MHPGLRACAAAVSAAMLASSSASFAAAPQLPGVGAAMQRYVEAREFSGVVTLVTTKDRTLHLDTTGYADLAAARPMTADTIFWIASMTKPVTAVAVLMLQDEGRLNVADPVAKYLPEFAALKAPSGQPANLTLTHVLTHTSGLAEAPREASRAARQLADLIPAFLGEPMQFEPGTQWKYCQAGIQTAARIVEVVSGQAFEVFLEERLFGPLGMEDTTFFPRPEQLPRLATNYVWNRQAGSLDPVPQHHNPAVRDRPPLPNGGLFSTAPDYARFCRMLLQHGTLDGKRYLLPETVALMTSDHTGDLAAGFIPGSAWGLATTIVREPTGLTAMLSPGTFGHGGRNGTQAWIDPVQGVAYVLMIQRDNMGNSDGSLIRRDFQQAATDALARL